ncbi:hypothetical protein EVAR_25386_1 [Eumeta japonica]|uniref:Uncharacterized protein n=1 Tax=Eumeta variegata TaxID=151549 RepID=A0A4C1V7R6_EUMVA|nr:hypothetical protein EVAR_25386_1 [Eumeta japonica]
MNESEDSSLYCSNKAEEHRRAPARSLTIMLLPIEWLKWRGRGGHINQYLMATMAFSSVCLFVNFYSYQNINYAAGASTERRRLRDLRLDVTREARKKFSSARAKNSLIDSTAFRFEPGSFSAECDAVSTRQ